MTALPSKVRGFSFPCDIPRPRVSRVSDRRLFPGVSSQGLVISLTVGRDLSA